MSFRGSSLVFFSGVSRWRRLVLCREAFLGRFSHLFGCRKYIYIFLKKRTTSVMLRKELLDARKALRGVREGVSGPRSKKQRGEWEPVSIQNTHYTGIKWVVGNP